MAEPKKSLNPKLLLTAAVLIVAALVGLSRADTERVLSVLNQHQPGLYRVIDVRDGDTIAIDMEGKTETVRFIGVDTPETHHPSRPVQCFGREAGNHLRQLIGDSPVRLEADPTNQNRDRYSRLLRYVYLSDGTLLNARQIEDGYGFVYTAFPFVRMPQFIALEQQAREAGRGLWGECKPYLENGYINTEPA